MRRGVNLGNGLEAPSEGAWGYRIETAHLDAIRDAGFDGVRVPVRWDVRAEPRSPYTIAPAFLDRVDGVIEAALERGLIVQLDSHHYQGLLESPASELDRFVEIWRQIAAHYASAPPQLLFEPFNEPNGEYWTGARVTAIQARVLAAIRESNPTRLVIQGGPNWNSIDGLRDWTPPPDPHTAVTVHYYEPHAFSHQNAEWMGAEAPNFGRPWGTPADVRLVQEHAQRAARWAGEHGLALQVGEFGVNRNLPLAQRALWTRAVREAFEAEGAGWCVWDFAAAFRIWDPETRRYIPEMLNALLG
jgi:endoglucanase